MLDARQLARLEDIRRRCERFMAELAEETYRTRAGLKAASEQAAIYRRHADVLGEDSATLIAAARADAEARGDEEEARRLGFLFALVAGEVAAAAAKAITDDLESREAQKRVVVGPVPSPEHAPGASRDAAPTHAGAATLPFRQLTGEIANTKERERRAHLQALELGVVEELTPLFAERQGIVHAVARSLGFASARALGEATAGIDLDALIGRARGFLDRTRDMYRETMGWLVKKTYALALADADRHDLVALFRGARFDDSFQKREMVDTAERFLRESRIDLRAGGRIHLDVEPREHKAPRAFSAAIEVPGRVILCLAPIGGRRDWQRFFHELGKALHRAHTDPEAPFELRRLGDAGLHETWGFVLQYLLIDRGWLRRYTGLGRPNDYLFLAGLEKLCFLRRYAAKLCYEAELLASGSVEGAEDRFEHEMREALGVRYPRQLYLYDVDRGLMTAHYLRAWMFEAVLRRHLVHYFDEDWYRNPRAGEFLLRQWRLGQRLTIEGLLRDLGYDQLSFEEVERRLEQTL